MIKKILKWLKRDDFPIMIRGDNLIINTDLGEIMLFHNKIISFNLELGHTIGTNSPTEKIKLKVKNYNTKNYFIEQQIFTKKTKRCV